MKENLKFVAGVLAIALSVGIFMFSFFIGMTELSELKNEWGCENHFIVTNEYTYFAKYDGCYTVREGRYERLSIF